MHSEVADALKSDKPVVALESTIISHGMPYPRNLEVATKLEEIVRDNGMLPIFASKTELILVILFRCSSCNNCNY